MTRRQIHTRRKHFRNSVRRPLRKKWYFPQFHSARLQSQRQQRGVCIQGSGAKDKAVTASGFPLRMKAGPKLKISIACSVPLSPSTIDHILTHPSGQAFLIKRTKVKRPHNAPVGRFFGPTKRKCGMRIGSSRIGVSHPDTESAVFARRRQKASIGRKT